MVTEFPPERAFHYVVEAQAPRQRFTCGGIAAAFLVRLYQATGNAAHLELARNYMGFSMTSTERQFEVSQVCKSGWGAALLYAVTQETAYQGWTHRVADYFVGDQCEDGHWEDSGPYGREHHVNIMVTAEFVMILDAMIGALALA
jgi:rhamnogalacturonyl hydrolase YesR